MVSVLMGAVPPGSYLVISHVSNDIMAETVAAGTDTCNEHSAVSITPRGESRSDRFFAGLDLVPPGATALASGVGARSAWVRCPGCPPTAGGPETLTVVPPHVSGPKGEGGGRGPGRGEVGTGGGRMREGLWAPPNRALTTGLVLAITFVAAEALAVMTVMPVVARSLGGLWLYGWVFSAFMLGSIVGIVAAGREADRRGRPPRSWSAWCCSGPGSRWPASRRTMDILVAGRALQGIGAGAVPAVAYAAIGRSLPGPAAGPDDGAAVHRLGACPGWPARAERRGGPRIRLALGVPRAAPGGGRGRVDRGARADPARAARAAPGR